MLLALAANAGIAVEARGQSYRDSLVAGATVRLWTPELPRRPWIGVLQTERPDSLVLKAKKDRASRAVSRASITRLDVQIPRTRAQGARALGFIGLLSGAATGAALGAMAAALGAAYYPNGTDQPPASIWAFDVPVSAAVGGVMGAIGGALFPGKRWQRLPCSTGMQLACER